MEYLSELTTIQIVMVLFSAFLVGASKAGIKGMGLLIVPLMASVFGAKPSTGIVLPMLILADIMAVYYYRRNVEWSYIRKLIPWALAGVIAGVITGDVLTGDQFKWLLGGIIIAMLMLLLYNDYRKSDKIPDNRFFAGIMGLSGGFTTMVGNAAGPVFSIYLLAMRLPKKEFIGTGAWFFFIINLSKVPFHILSWETINTGTFLLNLILLPVIIVGMLVGIKAVKIFPDTAYRYFVIIMVFISALVMLFS
ncbi:MAG TPA: sulfite exporter TauE/SafE family protein [Bacteroidales bacterium]|nr:sulfite exporter TauE/SafE family protein [Bacteroidales bacterium]